MALLEAINDALSILGLPWVTSVTAPNVKARQLMALAQKVGDDLQQSHDWRGLLQNHFFTGDGATVTWNLPSDFDRFPPDFDFEDFSSNGSREWRRRGKTVDVYPALSNQQRVDFDYFSKSWVLDESGGRRMRLLKDTDTFVFSDYLLMLGVIYEFRRQKGLDFESAKEDFEKQKALETDADFAETPIVLGRRDDVYSDDFSDITWPWGIDT